MIDIDTGEWIAPIDWYEKPFVVDHNGYGVTEGYLDFKNVKMYQSTGHTINGQELFFGDVVLIDGEMRTVEWDSTWFAIVTVKDGKIKPLEWMMPDAILGNVHTPKEVLKQRAEELKDART